MNICQEDTREQTSMLTLWISYFDPERAFTPPGQIGGNADKALLGASELKRDLGQFDTLFLQTAYEVR